MSNQATMNGARAHEGETAARSVARNTGEFLHDLVTLGELQLRLLVLDGQEGLQRFIWPVVVILGGLAIGLAALPVLLIALALTLTEMLQFTPAQAAGIAAGAGLLVGLLLMAGGWLDGVLCAEECSNAQSANGNKTCGGSRTPSSDLAAIIRQPGREEQRRSQRVINPQKWREHDAICS